MTEREVEAWVTRLTRIWGTINEIPWYEEDGYLVGALNVQDTLSVTIHKKQMFLSQVDEGRLILAQIHYDKATAQISGKPFRSAARVCGPVDGLLSAWLLALRLRP